MPHSATVRRRKSLQNRIIPSARAAAWGLEEQCHRECHQYHGGEREWAPAGLLPVRELNRLSASITPNRKGLRKIAESAAKVGGVGCLTSLFGD
jgi:hypothetical protein